MPSKYCKGLLTIPTSSFVLKKPTQSQAKSMRNNEALRSCFSAVGMNVQF